ncbi:MAG TPA: hypothetical protein VMV27_10845 [Candidatus Binataceae bacterium]|nr:hypothetical protein [Candidatus Binataceae bacterium]
MAAIIALAAATLAGCAGANSPYDLATWFGFGKPNLTSFLGVRFGASLDRVREELPDGDFETSPYGADAWRVSNVESGGVIYRSVVFEFTSNLGMQMAIAQFAPGAAATVLGQLKRALGEPAALRSGGGAASDPDTLMASWELPHNERVTFNGPDQQVEMLGPAGSPLRHDAVLRRARNNGTE